MSSPTDRFVPRYYEIEQALRARVAKLAPGDPLPSDAELCQEFGVSRMTARNAMAPLVQAGIVQRIPGRGTFVAQQPVHRQAGSLISFSDEMRRRGRRPSSRLLTRGTRAGTGAETVSLGLRSGSEVAELVRLRLADEEPIAIEASAFAPSLAAVLESADLEGGSLFDTLVGAGHVPTAGRASLVAEAATATDARHLRIKRGGPLLVERRLIFDQSGRPLELTESRYAADRYALEVSFDVELG
ncbi:MAG TPA: GntR family transcriptional regulator [Solirubrobacteraceae bacterium]|nr:GntR family transcriptional regulator [Solirubrobacteraceae bacterium]